MVAVAPRTPPSLVEIDGARMRLHFHRGQQQAWQSRKRFVCIIAGAQSGKTSFGPHWLRREIAEQGPGDYMVVTPTFVLLEGKALPEFRRLFEQQLSLGTYKSSPVRQFTLSPEGEIRLFGSRQDTPTIVRFGYAEDPESLEAMTAKGAWLDEAGQKRFKLGSWEAIRRRLALHRGRVLLTTTPYNLGWLYEMIWRPWIAADRDHPTIDVVNFASTMNPAFSEAEFEELRASMPAWKFDLFHRGIFTRPAGLIYDNWDEGFLVDPFPIPDHWPRFMGADFGGVNTAALYTAVELDSRNQPTGRLIHYREYLAGNLSAAEHARAMRRGEPMVPTAIGGAPSEDQWRREFTIAGLPIYRPPVSDVEVGIDRVYGAHQRKEIVVFRTLSMYLEQKRTYSRVLDAKGEPTEKIEDKETYHMCFVAGTMVTTVHGPVRIEHIQPGTHVLTRSGWRPVKASVRSDERMVRKVGFSNGRSLTGTPDHPLWIRGRGWVSLDAVRYGDILLTEEEAPCHRNADCSTVSPFTATRSPKGNRIGAISSVKASCFTEQFGRHATDPSRPVVTSTIKTVMVGITTSTIWSLSPRWTISRHTMEGPRHEDGSICSRLRSLLPQCGMRVMRGVRGIVNMLPTCAPGGMSEKSDASNAVASTEPGNSEVGAPTARRRARQQRDGLQVLTTSRRSVSSVESSLSRAGIASSGTALVHVVGLRDAGSAPVYNLTVEDRHEYFANGVLVSNCDAERYLMSHLRRPAGRERGVR